MLDKLLPFLVHPNRQIRENVAKYVTILAVEGHNLNAKEEESKGDNVRVVVDSSPLFSLEEFYCFVRPKLSVFLADQSDLMQITSVKDLLGKLRPPLQLKIMRKYFRKFSQLEQTTTKDRENYQMQEKRFESTNC